MINKLHSNSIRCSACGRPLGYRVNSHEFEMEKYNKGRKHRVSFRYSGDEASICCQDCQQKITFRTRVKQVPLMYVIARTKISTA